MHTITSSFADLLHGIGDLNNEEKGKRLVELRKHLSDLMIVLRQATSWARDVNII